MANSERPQVLHLITRLLKGGAERETITIAIQLDKYEFTVGYGDSYDSTQVRQLEQAGIDTKQFPLIKHYNPISSAPAVISLASYLRRNDFDIVHTHSTEAGIIGRFAAVLANVPNVVHTVHGIPFSDDRSPVLNRFILTCERIAARFSDRIVTNADIIAEDYLARGIGSPEQYLTVYSGIDLHRFRNAAPATDLPGARPRIVMISRLTEGKGFEVLFDAVPSLRQDVSICIVGDGPLHDSLLREMYNRGIDDRVFLTGYRDDIESVLAACDILTLPSFREGTPRVITEAMAAGLPVVATDIAGIPEQVEDGVSGFLVPPGDPDALANALSKLLTDRALRERMGERGLGRAGRFSVEAMCDDLENLYEELVAESENIEERV